jgi:HK97 family phage portal protein
VTRRKKQPKSVQQLATWNRGYYTNESFYVPQTTAGKTVTAETSLAISAFFCGVKLLADVQSSLPIDVYVKRGRNKEIAESHPAYRVLKREPNRLQTPKTFWHTAFLYRMLWGFAFAQIQWIANGNIKGLTLIEPWRVAPRLRDDGDLEFVIDGDVVIQSDDALYMPHMSLDGVHGRSVIQYARESLGHALATQEYGARLFGNGGRPTGILKHPGSLKKETRDQVKSDWNSFQNGTGTALLPEGMDYLAISMPPEDCQFLQTRQFQTIEIAQWLNLPPHMLKDMAGAKYNNIEHQAIEFITYTLMPTLVEFEQEIDRKILSGNYYCKYDVAALLRGDLSAQSAWYREMHNIGVFNINEIREQIDWNGIGEEGEHRFVNSTMISIDRAVNPQNYMAPPEPPADEPADDEPEDDLPADEVPEDQPSDSEDSNAEDQ